MSDNKTKNVTVSEIKEHIDFTIQEFDAEYNGLTFLVKPILTIEEMAMMVSNVVESCFSDEGEYYPQVLEYAFRCEIIDRYTNITLPQNINEKYLLTYSGIIDVIKEKVDNVQLRDIYNAINDKIGYIKQSNVEAISKQIGEIYSIIDGLQDQFGELYQGVDGKDLMKILQSLSENGISEEKLVEAYAKIHSDES